MWLLLLQCSCGVCCSQCNQINKATDGADSCWLVIGSEWCTMGSSACEHRARHTVNEIFYYTISWQSACRFTTHVTCRLTAKNWDQLRNQTLGNPVWTLLFFISTNVDSYQTRCRWHLASWHINASRTVIKENSYLNKHSFAFTHP